MNYENELTICAEDIARWAIDAGWNPDLGGYELTDADLEYLRGEQSDSLDCLPFMYDCIQKAFERDVEEAVNEILRGVNS